METKTPENIANRKKKICWVGPQKGVGRRWETRNYFMVPNLKLHRDGNLLTFSCTFSANLNWIEIMTIEIVTYTFF